VKKKIENPRREKLDGTCGAMQLVTQDGLIVTEGSGTDPAAAARPADIL